MTPRLLVILALLLAAACDGDGSAERDAGADADGDAATDAETDAGTDAETDADAEADGEPATIRYEDLEQLDRDVLQTASTAYAIFADHAATIWTEDYRFDDLPLTLLRRDGGRGAHAYLLNHPGVDVARRVEMPAGLENLETTLRVEELSSYPPADSYFEIGWMVEGTETLLMVFLESSDPMDDVTDPGWLIYMVHEGFHRYQDTVAGWGWIAGATQDYWDYPLEPTNAALAMVEGRALIAALEAATGADRLVAVEDFLVVRADRLERWPIVRGLDESQEKLEGTARYMELGVDAELGWPGVDRLLSDLELCVDPTYLAGAAGDVLAFDRFYGTGAAIGVLLDELSPGWKSRMSEDDVAPADLLRAAVPVTVTSERLDEALLRHDHDAALAAAESFDYTVRIFD